MTELKIQNKLYFNELSFNIKFYETSLGNVNKKAFGELYNIYQISSINIFID